MSKPQRIAQTDAVERIASFNAQWDRRLLPLKFEAMAHDGVLPETLVILVQS